MNLLGIVKDRLVYTRPTTATAMIVEVNKYTSWEPSIRVHGGGGSLMLKMGDEIFPVQMACLFGYYDEMAVTITYMRVRKTNELYVLNVGAPYDS